ncbi:hypothetical protein SAMN05421821_109182 [Mucilaginibacter lappiensis]|uniref:Uncharacterized protein n=1 Tax=Mucilaginibacter lappiensis TaxID=354630 RepID=A0A1N7CI09_9SPHI|nr:hypothetical protein [Mucilaginibacter lappiensis]MBB6128150.1 hypothetical protein [Mucilaginibacter lappiensis]SIR63251.1 hypothetical protein SAMN05421821_109182 [Mucilaginibacter lappiensis]
MGFPILFLFYLEYTVYLFCNFFAGINGNIITAKKATTSNTTNITLIFLINI